MWSTGVGRDACTRGRSPGGGDTRPDTATGAASAWPDAAGAFLAVATNTAGEALLFRRDTTVVPGDTVVSSACDSTAAPAAHAACRARLRRALVPRCLLRLTDAPPGWSLALDAAHAHPLLIDALEDLSHADSQQVVVRIQRALNTLPDTGGAMEFRGLPVVVRDAWVVQLPGERLVVARAARLRNLEAAAHEELRLAVLEGDQLRYVARVAGDEETVESWDLLAALMIQGHPWLAIAREGASFPLQLEFVAHDTTVAFRLAQRCARLRGFEVGPGLAEPPMTRITPIATGYRHQGSPVLQYPCVSALSVQSGVPQFGSSAVRLSKTQKPRVHRASSSSARPSHAGATARRCVPASASSVRTYGSARKS